MWYKFGFIEMYITFPRTFSRLPVLDSTDTIEIIKKYLAEANFTVFEV